MSIVLTGVRDACGKQRRPNQTRSERQTSGNYNGPSKHNKEAKRRAKHAASAPQPRTDPQSFGMRRARNKQLWATIKGRGTHVHNYNYMALRHNHLTQPLLRATAGINRTAKLQPTHHNTRQRASWQSKSTKHCAIRKSNGQGQCKPCASNEKEPGQ